jgi:hypothetical protein
MARMTSRRAPASTEWVLKATFQELFYQRVMLEGMC